MKGVDFRDVEQSVGQSVRNALASSQTSLIWDTLRGEDLWAGFGSKSSLQRPQRMHLGKQPFVCQEHG